MIKRRCIAFHFGKSLIGNAKMEARDNKLGEHSVGRGTTRAKKTGGIEGNI